MKDKFRWALVLSGGGARGFAHIGVLKTLERMGAPEPSLIAGCSMGAIVGGLRACGMKADELDRFAAEEFDIRHYLDGIGFQMTGPIAKIVQAGQAMTNLAFKPGIDSGRRALELLERLTGDRDFGQTDIPFRCNAVDLVSGRLLTLSEGSVARAVRASMSYPAFFEPVPEGGARLIDGGLADNLPVDIAKAEGFKRILAVNVGSGEKPTAASLTTGPAVIYRAMQIAAEAANRENEAKPSLLIEARDGTSPFDFVRARHLIDLGERCADERAEELALFFDPSPFAPMKLRMLQRKRNA